MFEKIHTVYCVFSKWTGCFTPRSIYQSSHVKSILFLMCHSPERKGIRWIKCYLRGFPGELENRCKNEVRLRECTGNGGLQHQHHNLQEKKAAIPVTCTSDTSTCWCLLHTRGLTFHVKQRYISLVNKVFICHGHGCVSVMCKSPSAWMCWAKQ